MKPKSTKPKSPQAGDDAAAVIAKIALMPPPYPALGKRLHALILASAPELRPTLWYGMPAYAKDGRRICFFRADKYLTFGLTPEANLAPETGAAHQLLASAWYLTALDEATEAKLAAIVRQAAS